MKAFQRKESHVVDLLFILALFCVFAASSLMVVLIGASVYQQTVSHMDQNYNMRTSLSYVSEKVRQNDVDGAVYAGDLGGQEALVLERTYNGSAYHTYIYCYDNTLRELFVRADSGAGPQDGQEIMELADFHVEERDGLLSLSATDLEGRVETLLVGVRSQRSGGDAG